MHESAFFLRFLVQFEKFSVIIYITVIVTKERGSLKMGTYNIPRNVKGEGRILFIFSTKSLIYTAIGIGVGLPFYFIFNALKLTILGLIFVALFALIGFSIGTFKVPEIGALKASKTIGGEKIDDIIKRAITFRRKGNRIYLYTKEEKKNG